ncbi:hypothetical protein [Salinicoccus sp. HZC-1]|uniref:hypothetical protein n=1 Tax=Salinicoccus sp. HZC-1 TaxID=3385497 RepID=UPI00398B545A
MLKKMMNTSVHNIYFKSPVFMQHAFTSAYGYKLRRERYNHLYRQSFRRYMAGDLETEEMLADFMHHLKQNIPIYSDIKIDEGNLFESFLALPMTEKEDLRNELEERSHTVGIMRKSRTSGTTGENLAVYDSEYDRADRMAYLDYIKALNGVEPFSKRASFTGQELTPTAHRNVLWRYNMPMNQILYATYHMTPENVRYVYEHLARFKPATLDGFPTSIHMLAKYILSEGLKIEFEVKGIFPTAETLLPHVKEDIEKAFNTKVIDQYSSAEGAPFIYGTADDEYRVGHETGLIEFEKVGFHLYEMIVTSFINRATPIVRYRIGDQVEIHSDKDYLNSFEDDIHIERIIGRQSDYLLGSRSNKVTNVNISWVVDGLEEKVIQMQFIQKEKNRFVVNIVAEDDFEKSDEKVIRDRLARRLGEKSTFIFNYMKAIPKEKSGKVRFIINELE